MVKTLRLLDVGLDAHLRKDLERLAQMSAESQELLQPITKWDKLGKSSDRVYILIQDGALTGYIRIGIRQLYLTPDPCAVALKSFTVLCLLDFFVENQRQGNGKFLFNHCLNSENRTAQSVAYDRPSPKLVQFLSTHFNISDLVHQPNNFAISEQFFTLYLLVLTEENFLPHFTLDDFGYLVTCVIE